MTSSEMLAAWRQALGFDTNRADCSVTAFEGVDIDAMIRRRMRLWYLTLLDSAPLSFIPVEDVAAQVKLIDYLDDWAYAPLPLKVRRVLSVKLSGWKRDTLIISPEEARHIMRRMASPFAKPGPAGPVAILRSDGLYLTPPLGSLEIMKAVIDPGPDTYILDESLLSAIPKSLL